MLTYVTVSIAPRLFQLSADDPYFTSKSVNWDLVKDSGNFPFSERLGFWKALHPMACRTQTFQEYTNDPVLQKLFNIAVDRLATLAHESVQCVVEKDNFSNINVDEVNEDALELAFPQAMGWGWTRLEGGQGQDDSVLSGKGGALNRLSNQYLRVLMAVLLMLDGLSESRRKEEIERQDIPRSQKQELLKKTKVKPFLNTLVEKKIIAKKKDQGLIGRSAARISITGSQEEPVKSAVKSPDKVLQDAINHSASDFRRDCLQALSMFLLYGTAGFFHVWTTPKSGKSTCGAQLIHLAAINADRFEESDRVHVYGSRAWNNLDLHVMKLLKGLISGKTGGFKKKIDWAKAVGEWKSQLDRKTLGPLFLLDFHQELFSPGESRAPDGSRAPAVATQG